MYMTLRFSTDGAKMEKNISSVRGVVKPPIPRDKLPKDMSSLSMSPEDEYTLYLYMGKCYVFCKHMYYFLLDIYGDVHPKNT